MIVALGDTSPHAAKTSRTSATHAFVIYLLPIYRAECALGLAPSTLRRTIHTNTQPPLALRRLFVVYLCMDHSARDDGDVIRYIQGVVTKHREQHGTADEAPHTTREARQSTSQRHNIANSLPEDTRGLASAIGNAVQAAVTRWFEARPTLVNNAVQAQIGTLVEVVIQKEVRKWINEYLPQYVRHAVQELIDTIKKP